MCTCARPSLPAGLLVRAAPRTGGKLWVVEWMDDIKRLDVLCHGLKDSMSESRTLLDVQVRWRYKSRPKQRNINAQLICRLNFLRSRSTFLPQALYIFNNFCLPPQLKLRTWVVLIITGLLPYSDSFFDLCFSSINSTVSLNFFNAKNSHLRSSFSQRHFSRRVRWLLKS
jgi:hypothetical protein